MSDEIKKDVNVKINMDVTLANIRVFGDMDDPDVDVEQIAYEIQQYIAAGGDFEFKYEVLD